MIILKDEKLKELYPIFLEFVPLFHQKISSFFSNNDDNKYRCNKNQHKAIMVIGNMDKVTPTMLGKYLNLKKGSLTTLIDSLEKSNLLYRNMDLHDRRKTILKLTEEGKDYFHSKNKELESQLKSMFSVLEEEELNKFIDSFNNIVKTLKSV